MTKSLPDDFNRKKKTRTKKNLNKIEENLLLNKQEELQKRVAKGTTTGDIARKKKAKRRKKKVRLSRPYAI